MYIIDGHNLIPKIPGLSLRSLDDEVDLVKLLQEFSRVQRKQVMVFFDDAPPGQAGPRSYGTVRAYFVPKASEADEAISKYLIGLGNKARNSIVVTSDHKVQAYARERHAQVMTSEAFAELLAQSTTETQAAAQQAAALEAAKKAAGALQEWYDVFGIDPQKAAKPIDISRPVRHARKPPAIMHKPEDWEEPRDKKQKKGKQRKHHGFEKKR